ncbi:MAG: AAA family ATPase, partial [Anaerolineaceae bacterium]
MKIERLQIDGFGHLHEREFGPFDSPLTVLLGPNEAGKSTTLDFIRTMLFGFSAPGKLAFHRPLAGGQHGGKAVLRAEDGRRYVVERRPGVHGGTVRVTTDDGHVFETDTELRRLLGHATEAMYGNVFAFGLSELQTGKSLDGPEVTGQIYNAGLGAANLPGALKVLGEGAEKLFKPGGSIQNVAELLTRLQALEHRLDGVRGDSAEYGRLTSRLSVIADELDAATGEAARLSERSTELERLRKGWGEWLELLELQGRRAGLHVVENFPQSAIARLESSEKSVREGTEGVREALVEVEAAAALVAKPIKDEALLTDVDAIEQIRRQRGSLDDSLRDLPKRQQEAAEERRDLQAALASLGTTWDETKVTNFDLSIALRDEVEQRRQRLDEADREARESKAAANATAQTETNTTEKLSEVRQEMELLPAPERSAEEIGARRAVIRETRTALEQFLRAQSNREQVERWVEDSLANAAPRSSGSGQRGLAVSAALLAIVAIGAGLALGGKATFLGLLVGVPMFVVAAFAFRSARGGQVNETIPATAGDGRIVRATAAEGAALAHLREVARPLATAPVSSAGLDAMEEELDHATLALTAWTAAQERVASALREAERARRRAAELLQVAEQREARLADSRASWRAWLVARGLPDSVAPATAATMFERIGSTQSMVNELREADRRVAAIEKDIRGYRERVTALATPHGLVVGEAAVSPGAIADELCRRFDAAVLAAASRNAATFSLVDCERRLKVNEDRLTDSQCELGKLLTAASAADAEELRWLDAQNAEAARLEQQIREAEQKLVMLSGPGAQCTAFKETLAGTTMGEIDADFSTTLEERKEAEARRDALLDERGSASERLTSLSSDDTASELLAERETLLERLRSYAREWSTLTLARHLLERARSKYEAERQPDVLKHAQSFLRGVTGGRYATLISPLGTHNVTII